MAAQGWAATLFLFNTFNRGSNVELVNKKIKSMTEMGDVDVFKNIVTEQKTIKKQTADIIINYNISKKHVSSFRIWEQDTGKEGITINTDIELFDTIINMELANPTNKETTKQTDFIINDFRSWRELDDDTKTEMTQKEIDENMSDIVQEAKVILNII